MDDYDLALEEAFGTGLDGEMDTSSNINSVKPQRIGFVGAQYNELPLTDNWKTMVEITEMAQYWKCSIEEAREKLKELGVDHDILIEQEKAA